jgi:hypothetical protein
VPRDLRLPRQFEQVERLPPEDSKSVLKMIDAPRATIGEEEDGMSVSS